jgi:uncharacterized protein (TIGR02284 family)
MTATNDPVVETLNDLIATCKDAEFGYQTAANDVESMDLKQAFDDCSRQRAEFAEQLEQRVVQRGGAPKTRGTVAGKLYRGWMTLKCGLMGNCEHSVLVDCDRGERIALEHYKHALGLGLPPDVIGVVQSQHEQILQTQKQVHSLAMASAA